MKRPRFRLVQLMVVVAFVALDCAVVQELAQSGFSSRS